MSTFQENLQSAKSGIAQAKQNVSTDVFGVKEGIKQGTENARATKELAFGSDAKEIIEQHGNVRIHADGSISVVKFDGSILPNIHPDELENTLIYESAQRRDAELGASNSKLVGLANQGIGVAGSLTAGAAEAAAKIFHVGTTAKSRTEGIANHNAKNENERINNALFHRGNENARHKKISDWDALQYDNIQAKLKGKQDTTGTSRLTKHEKEFQQSDTYKTIETIDAEVEKSRLFFGSIKERTQELQDKYVPTTRADDVATSLAYKRIAKEEGTIQAVIDTAVNDWDQLIKQGFESIPYMVAFTIGGPIAQTGILISLSLDKARETSEEFIAEHGRDPNEFEKNRINLWSTVATVAEKFGDMAALKALPDVLKIRALDLETGVSKMMPDSVRTVINKTSFISKPALGLAGEGLSGAITSASEQIAATGEVSDIDQVAFDALAEALGTPGGVGGLVAGKLATDLTVGVAKAIKNAPVTTTKTPSGSTPSAEKPTEVDTSPIEPADFDSVIADIEKADLEDALILIAPLSKRALTDEQITKQAEVLRRLIGTAEEGPKTVLGSIGEVQAATTEKLEAIIGQAEGTDQDFVQNLIELKEAEDQLETAERRTPKNLKEVNKEVIEGKPGKWTGFKTFFNEIRDVLENETDNIKRDKAVARIEEQMQHHADNLQAKADAIAKAKNLPEPAAGNVRVIRGTRKNAQIKTDRRMNYEASVMSLEKFNALRAEKKFVLNTDGEGFAKLDNIINKEAAYGKKVLEAVEQHKQTSFKKNADEAIAVNEAVKKHLITLQNAGTNVAVEEELDVDSVDTAPPTVAEVSTTQKVDVGISTPEARTQKAIDQLNPAQNKFERRADKLVNDAELESVEKRISEEFGTESANQLINRYRERKRLEKKFEQQYKKEQNKVSIQSQETPKQSELDSGTTEQKPKTPAQQILEGTEESAVSFDKEASWRKKRIEETDDDGNAVLNKSGNPKTRGAGVIYNKTVNEIEKCDAILRCMGAPH